ncbi:MAG: hypothetical protein IT320_13600 [Anaerolineae bacterium]|nr:hypothetical protein [Anaerolineae bacterium]
MSDGEQEAAVALAQAIDADAELEQHINPLFDEALHNQPDAVYRFVRGRLAAKADPRWLFRLRQAALAALHVAITDGDPETILNWLILIAREPVNYDLGEILHHGILAAQTRAHEDPALARGLILLALKRTPAALALLLDDETLLEALPENFREMIQSGDGDLLGLLSEHSSDAFLLAVAQAIRHKNATAITAAVVEQLWHFYGGGAGASLPSQYRPDTAINALAESGASWLSTPAFDRLLALSLRDGRDSLFHRFAGQLASAPDKSTRIAAALHRAHRAAAETAALITALVAAGTLQQDDVSDLYAALLMQQGWDEVSQPIVDQLARLMQQNQTVVLPEEALWHMLDFGVQHSNELATRAAARRLCSVLEKRDDDEALIEGVVQLVQQTSWHPPAKEVVQTWWRNFTRSLPTARLNKLERGLDGKRLTDEPRAVVQTILAFRRMLGKRTLKQFADEVHLTFSTLEALSNAFDADGKRPINFDLAVARTELEAQDENLTPQELQVLASDFKDLAELIGLLGDRRTKPNLIRREEEVDRQLIQGEQSPHSAVDVLKWMAGYLGGLQDDEREV